MNLSKQIARIIAETAVFLEFSDESVVDPDAALSLMERIATFLGDLEPSELEELNVLLTEVSVEYSDEEVKQFVKKIGIYFGFVDED